MKRKVTSAVLAAAMAVSMLAGGSVAKAEASEVEKIKIYVPTSGASEDIDNVMAAVNEITREKIGVEVEFKPFEFGQWFQQYSLFLSGTEDVDIIANYGGYLNAVSQGAAYDLTDLVQEYGQDIIEMEGEFLKSGQIDGVQYAIPIYASYAWTMGIIYRQDVVDELGLTEQVAEVKNLEDWGDILAVVK